MKNKSVLVFVILISVVFASCSNFFHNMIPSSECGINSLELYEGDENVTLSTTIGKNDILVVANAACDITKLIPKVSLPKDASLLPLTKEYVDIAFPSSSYEQIALGLLTAQSSGTIEKFAMDLLEDNPDFVIPQLDQTIDFSNTVVFLVVAGDGTVALHNVQTILRNDVSAFEAIALDSKIKLTWKNPVDQPFEKIIIECNGEPVTEIPYSDFAESFVVRSLKNGKTYDFTIRIDFGSSSYGRILKCSGIPYAAPVKDVLTSSGDGYVKLGWRNPDDDDISYVRISVSPNPITDSFYQYIYYDDNPNNECTFKTLENKKNHTFSIYVVYKSGNISATVTVNDTPSTDLKPGDLSLSGITLYGKIIDKTAESYIVVPNTVATATNVGENSLIAEGTKFYAFSMGRYEVTQGLFHVVQQLYPNLLKGISCTAPNSNLPVENVNTFDAMIFCNLLSMEMGLEPVYSYYGETDPAKWFKNSNLSTSVPTSSSSSHYDNWKDNVVIQRSNNGYRLPTCAEWEFAARGGNSSSAAWNFTYSGSNTPDDVGWFGVVTYMETVSHPGGSHQEPRQKNVDNSITVGSKNKNTLNLYDMSGNVSEIVTSGSGIYYSFSYTRSWPNGSYHSGPFWVVYMYTMGGSWSDHSSKYGVVKIRTRWEDIYRNVFGISNLNANDHDHKDSTMAPQIRTAGKGFRLCRSLQ